MRSEAVPLQEHAAVRLAVHSFEDAPPSTDLEKSDLAQTERTDPAEGLGKRPGRRVQSTAHEIGLDNTQGAGFTGGSRVVLAKFLSSDGLSQRPAIRYGQFP